MKFYITFVQFKGICVLSKILSSLSSHFLCKQTKIDISLSSISLIFLLNQIIHQIYSISHYFLSSHTLSHLFFSSYFLLTTKHRLNE
jgi:hypothetical protein